MDEMFETAALDDEADDKRNTPFVVGPNEIETETMVAGKRLVILRGKLDSGALKPCCAGH